MKLTPFFPEKIFDGTYAGRPDTRSVSPPGYYDYLKLAREIEETQKFILTNLENLRQSPDLLGIFKRLELKAKKIEKKLEKSAPPEQFDVYIRDVDVKLSQMEARLQKFQTSLAKIELSLFELSDKVDTIEKSWDTDVTAFQRHNRGEFARLKEQVGDELGKLKTMIKQLKAIF